MSFTWIMVIVLVVAQIEAICVTKYLIGIEEKHCSKCDWWIKGCTKPVFVMSFIPFVGLFSSIAFGVDCVNNIIKAMND